MRCLHVAAPCYRRIHTYHAGRNSVINRSLVNTYLLGVDKLVSRHCPDILVQSVKNIQRLYSFMFFVYVYTLFALLIGAWIYCKTSDGGNVKRIMYTTVAVDSQNKRICFIIAQDGSGSEAVISDRTLPVWFVWCGTVIVSRFTTAEHVCEIS